MKRILLLSLLLAGCAHGAPLSGVPVAVCQPVKVYDKAFLGRAQAALAALPHDSEILTLMADYEAQRDEQRACAALHPKAR